ncbi:MAG: hypothetical protein R3B70_02425 [Polyangiaceae bacterium]
MTKPRSYLRRGVLSALAAAALFGPAVSSGCAVNFSPPGKVSTLRVIAVTADKPYIEPIPASECAQDPEKCTIHFDMEVYDALGVAQTGSERQINILWIGGCFNPEGDQYSLCLFPALDLFGQAKGALDDAIATGNPPEFPEGLPVGWGKKFSLVVPDIVSSRPPPTYGPHYGIGYVFFLACAGKFGIKDADPSAAGTFPIGCFDKDTGAELGPESFVPGYTQIYSFEDGRQNQNPELTDVLLDGEPISAEFDEIPTVAPCDVPPDERNQPSSCTREDPFVACTPLEIDVDVPDDIGEVDPDAKGEDGQPLKETVWVNYYTDTGDFESDIKLLSDATTGSFDKHSVQWLPPAEPGLATIWAVVRDSRGGSSVAVRYVRVE